MTTRNSPEVEVTAIERLSSHALGRASLLLGAYLIGAVAPAMLSVGGAVYLTGAVPLSLAGVLAVWMGALGGVALAPTTGRYALAIVATRIDGADAAEQPYRWRGPSRGVRKWRN